MAFAFGRLDGPRAGAEEVHDLAEAQLDAGIGGLVGQLRGEQRAVGGTVDTVQFGEVDEGAPRRELVEAEGFQAGARGAGGCGETGRTCADHDDVVRSTHGLTNLCSGQKFKCLDRLRAHT